jgi:hypothetical protein
LHEQPPRIDLDAALEESNLVMFECVEKLLTKLNLRGADVNPLPLAKHPPLHP